MIPHLLLTPPLVMAGSQPLIAPHAPPAPLRLPHIPRLAPFSLPAAPLLGNRLSYAPVHSPYSFNYGYNIQPYRTYAPSSNYGNSYVKVSNTMSSSGSSNYATYNPKGFSSHYNYQVTNSAPKKTTYGSDKESYVKVASGVKINPSPCSIVGISASAHPVANHISSGTAYNTPTSIYSYQYEVQNKNNKQYPSINLYSSSNQHTNNNQHTSNNQYANSNQYASNNQYASSNHYINTGYNKGGGSSTYVKVSTGYKMQVPPTVNGYSYAVNGPLNYGKGYSSGYVHSSNTIPGYTVYSPGSSYEYSVHNRPSYGGSSAHVKVSSNTHGYGGHGSADTYYEYTVNNNGGYDSQVPYAFDNSYNSHHTQSTQDYQQTSHDQQAHVTGDHQQSLHSQQSQAAQDYQHTSYTQDLQDSYNQQSYFGNSSYDYDDDSSYNIKVDVAGGIDEYHQPSVHSFEYAVENYPEGYTDGGFGSRLKSYVKVKDQRIINGHSYGQH